MGDVAALLGGADQLLDGRIRQVEQRQRGIRRFGSLLLRRLFLFFLLLVAALVLLAITLSSNAPDVWRRPMPGAPFEISTPYPMRGESNGRQGGASVTAHRA